MSICLGVSVQLNDSVVTAMFPFPLHYSGYNPDKRIEKINCLDHELKQIDQIILSPNVGDLMKEYRFQLFCR